MKYNCNNNNNQNSYSDKINISIMIKNFYNNTMACILKGRAKFFRLEASDAIHVHFILLYVNLAKIFRPDIIVAFL